MPTNPERNPDAIAVRRRPNLSDKYPQKVQPTMQPTKKNTSVKLTRYSRSQIKSHSNAKDALLSGGEEEGKEGEAEE